MSEPQSSVDLAAVAAEVTAEARRRRTAPDFPHDLAEQLSGISLRFLPVHLQSDDLNQAVAVLSQRTFIDVNVPTTSRIAPVAVVKKTLKRLLSWYFRYVAQQVTTMANATVRLGKLQSDEIAALRDRVSELEASIAELRERRPGP